jgi:hypothetical protein
VAVDGINPTLALAALLLGMSGNPQDTTHHSAVNAQVEEQAACAAVADIGDPSQLPRADPVARPSVPAARVGAAPDPCEPAR